MRSPSLPEPVRILFLNRFFHPDHSATSQMLSDLAFHLAERGFAVTVITSRQRYDAPDADLPAYERVAGVEVRRVRTPRYGRMHLAGRLLDYLGFYLAASLELARRARAGTVIVAKTDPPLISIPAAAIARLRGAVLVNWLQDLFPEVAIELGVGRLRGVAGHLLRRMRNASLRLAAMNVAIGERMRARLQAEGTPAERVCVIPNWADGAAITPLPQETNPLRGEWGLSDRFVVAYSGNLGRAHEFGTVLDAAERLAHEPRIVFLFVGGGAQADSLRAEVERRRLANVQFRPYQPRVLLAQSLGVADVHLVVLRPELEGLIVPSKTYGCLAAGRPVIFIGAADGEIATLLSDAGAGATCALGDGAALAACIRGFTAGGRAESAGIAGRRVFDARYSMQQSCTAFERLFRALGASQTKPPEEAPP